jgi:hypothetical protein
VLRCVTLVTHEIILKEQTIFFFAGIFVRATFP